MMPTKGVAVLHAGLVTGLGLSAPSTCAALRAALDGFGETRFRDQSGEWISGCEVPLVPAWRGPERLVQMLAMAVGECLEAAGVNDPSDLPLLLCIAEPGRPGFYRGLEQRLLDELQTVLGVQFDAGRSAVIAQGRVGGAVAMAHAAALLREQSMPAVLIAAVDSLLIGTTLQALERDDRLLTSRHSNGFIPGEAAGALWVGPPGIAPGRHLVCLGAGFGVEPAPLGSGRPLRSDGLTQAFRQALAEAGLAMAQIGYRIATISGEQYAFKQFDLATMRLLRGKHEFMDLWHPASGIGETGAVAALACIAMALAAVQKGYAAGEPVLIAAANDDGRCAALVLAAAGPR